MKKLGLNIVLGILLLGGSAIAGAVTRDPSIVNNAATLPSGDKGGNSTTTSSVSLTSTVLCAMGFSGYCSTPDTIRDPTIINN